MDLEFYYVDENKRRWNFSTPRPEWIDVDLARISKLTPEEKQKLLLDLRVTYSETLLLKG